MDNSKIMGYKLQGLPVEKVRAPKGAHPMQVMDINGEATLLCAINPEEIEQEDLTIFCLTLGKPFKTLVLDEMYLGSCTVAGYGIVHSFFFRRLRPVEVIENVDSADLIRQGGSDEVQS